MEQKASIVNRAISAEILHPYISFLILRCSNVEKTEDFQSLLEHMKNFQSRHTGVTWSVVAAGLDGTSDLVGTGGIDQIDGFIYELRGTPSWVNPESGYDTIDYSLAIAVRQDDLIAVHCASTLRNAILRWINNSKMPSIKRLPPEVLQGAFLKGEAKNLWLRGTHPRRTTKADSKTLSGRKLQDALSPFEDSTFAMSTARAALPADESRSVLVGNIGTTPRKALVWNGSTNQFEDFVTAAVEALSLVKETVKTGELLVKPYPVLASESDDLNSVTCAYDIAALSVDDLPEVESSDELIQAAETLQRAVFNVHGSSGSADFTMEVGLDNSFGGALRVLVSSETGESRFKIRYDIDSPTSNLPVVKEVKEALECGQELLAVYYDSGHVVDSRSIWTPQVRPAPFPCWNFEDFSGFDIGKEKPNNGSAEDIHKAIGRKGDNSLFHWVQKHYSAGWLTCDDGSGEVADFMHICPKGTLSFIHVKKSGSRGKNRQISAASYEIVTSQAAKNLANLNPDLLRSRLSSPGGFGRASWTDGSRVKDRSEFLEMLDARSARDETRIVIVQPHVSKIAYEAIQSSAKMPGSQENYHRLNLLETLLNTIRGSVTALGADLDVISSTT